MAHVAPRIAIIIAGPGGYKVEQGGYNTGIWETPTRIMMYGRHYDWTYVRGHEPFKRGTTICQYVKVITQNEIVLSSSS